MVAEAVAPFESVTTTSTVSVLLHLMQSCHVAVFPAAVKVAERPPGGGAFGMILHEYVNGSPSGSEAVAVRSDVSSRTYTPVSVTLGALLACIR